MAEASPDAALCHWADQVAERVLAAWPGRERFVVAAGITPSGVVHVGNFREVITVDLVARALRDRGVPVRFLYSWDDFDVFRKVPRDLPDREAFAAQLRRSLVDVPDPWGCHESYASHFVAQFEGGIAGVGIAPEFIRQSARYRSGHYAHGIRRALEHRDRIRDILDRHRAEPLPEDWLPLVGFCGACGRDPLSFGWDGGWTVRVRCGDCGHEAEVDLREGGALKLPWRVDWPMRWAEEGVAFEPGGKDHSSAGGSYDTAKEIVRAVYDAEPPVYLAYDFVRIKGRGGKISSSAGEAVTVQDVLEVYEPEMLRWIFASTRPGSEFQISFDLDVVKLYEDWDRAWRLAAEPDDGSRRDAKRQLARRTLRLATLDHRPLRPGEAPPELPPFRHVAEVLLAAEGDADEARRRLEVEGAPADAAAATRLAARVACAARWLARYAPEEFRWHVRKQPEVRPLGEGEQVAIGRLVAALEAHPEAREEELVPHLKVLCEGTALEPRDLFPVVYDLLIARPRGPKLSTLLQTIGAPRALPLLRASLEEARPESG